MPVAAVAAVNRGKQVVVAVLVAAVPGLLLLQEAMGLMVLAAAAAVAVVHRGPMEEMAAPVSSLSSTIKH
jgi:hypothetical protein